MFANNHVTVYSETWINRSCSKVETLLKRTDTFDPVCFLYASLSRISKAESVKRTLLQADNIFQSSDKRVTCLTRTQIIVLRISEKQRINLDILFNILKKKRFFYTLKQFYLFIYLFLFHFAVFEVKWYF